MLPPQFQSLRLATVPFDISRVNMSTSPPVVLIVSSSNTKPKSLIKLITKNTFKDNESNDEHKTSQPWVIDTKYYTADITLVGISKTYERTQSFNETVEALIVHMDTNKDTGLEELQEWETIEKECEPEVKILLTNYCNDDTKITRAKALDWCIRHSYELIELYPSQKIDISEQQDIIEEKLGVDRVIEALQTHVWSNLVMKDRNTSTNLPKMPDDATLFEKMQDADLNDDFTELFSQLHMMKESLQSLPNQQRKQCAEQMVTAFWRAIGGDEEDIVDM